MMNFKQTEALIGAGPEFETAKLSYSKLAQHLLAIVAQRRKLDEELGAGVSDLYLRRVMMIRDGKELPGSDGLSGLPGWTDQLRREQIAHENAETDAACRRAGLMTAA
jgi:hypothetical protein